jgi:hypothetical protein
MWVNEISWPASKDAGAGNPELCAEQFFDAMDCRRRRDAAAGAMCRWRSRQSIVRWLHHANDGGLGTQGFDRSQGFPFLSDDPVIPRLRAEENCVRLHLAQFIDEGIETAAEHGVISAAGQAIRELEAKVQIAINDDHSLSACDASAHHGFAPYVVPAVKL